MAAGGNVTCDVHRGFRGAVQVVQLRVRQYLQKLCDAGGGEGLPADEDVPQLSTRRLLYLLHTQPRPLFTDAYAWACDSTGSSVYLKLVTQARWGETTRSLLVSTENKMLPRNWAVWHY